MNFCCVMSISSNVSLFTSHWVPSVEQCPKCRIFTSLGTSRFPVFQMDSSFLKGNFSVVREAISNVQGHISTVQDAISMCEGAISTTKYAISTGEGPISSVQHVISAGEDDISTVQGANFQRVWEPEHQPADDGGSRYVRDLEGSRDG